MTAFGIDMAGSDFTAYRRNSSTVEVLAAARRLTRQQNYFTYLLGLFLVPAAIRPFFYAWYAYFRWVDDRADSPELALHQKQRFLKQQAALVSKLYNHASVDDYKPNGPEAFLTALVIFDKQRESPLKAPILNLLSCIDYDVARMGTHPEQQQLTEHIELEVTSYLMTFFSFSCPGADLENFPRPEEGIAGKWAHILRDFLVDLKTGIINLSREENERFQINLREVLATGDDPGLRAWVADRVQEAERLFKRGKQNLLHLPGLRYKFGVAVLCAKYEYYLSVIKKNKYQLQENHSLDLKLFFLSLVKLMQFSGIIMLFHLRPHQSLNSLPTS